VRATGVRAVASSELVPRDALDVEHGRCPFSTELMDRCGARALTALDDADLGFGGAHNLGLRREKRR
jgi:hypothetical protein